MWPRADRLPNLSFFRGVPMRQGLFPGQQEALVELAKKGLRLESAQRRTRRAFLGLFGLGAGATTGAYWLGAQRAAAPATDAPVELPPAIRDMLPVAHRLALGSDADLRANAAMFLTVLDARGGDELTWAGFGRLARMAQDGGTERDRALAVRLVATVDALAPPPWLSVTVAGLRTKAGR